MASSETTSAALPSLAPKQADKSDKSEKPLPAETSSKPSKGSKDKEDEGIGIEELAMPRTMIQRLARSSLPPNTQLQKDAVLALSTSATMFINYIASNARDHLVPSKKTIQPYQVFMSLQELEFGSMVPILQAELEKFNTIRSNKKEEQKKKVKDGKAGPDGSTMLVGDEDSIADGVVQTRGADPGAQLEAESIIDRERSAKRAKGAGGAAVTVGYEDEDEDVDMNASDAAEEASGNAAAEEEEEEEEVDEDATESEQSEAEDIPGDRIDTEPEDEGEERGSRSEEEDDSSSD